MPRRKREGPTYYIPRGINLRIRFRHRDDGWWATCPPIGLRECHEDLSKLLHRLAWLMPERIIERGTFGTLEDDID